MEEGGTRATCCKRGDLRAEACVRVCVWAHGCDIHKVRECIGAHGCEIHQRRIKRMWACRHRHTLCMSGSTCIRLKREKNCHSKRHNHSPRARKQAFPQGLVCIECVSQGLLLTYTPTIVYIILCVLYVYPRVYC